MKGGRRLPAVAPHPGEDGGLRVCIDIPGLNRAASQEVGACASPGGTSFHRIGKRARRPPQAGLGGSPLEGHRPG